MEMTSRISNEKLRYSISDTALECGEQAWVVATYLGFFISEF